MGQFEEKIRICLILIYTRINEFWSIKMRILETGDMRISLKLKTCDMQKYLNFFMTLKKLDMLKISKILFLSIYG